ncbi:MAG TPA: cytochrome D1 domain-containing protein [Bryobacteraceae bacterium]|nr:cytochrome D1 domain-containing protein [Bryobacteraceae bacterium]
MKLPLFAALVCALSLQGAGTNRNGDPNNPTGTHGLVLIDKLGAHIRFFDPATFREISSFETEKAPHDLAFSPDHSIVYIPIYGDGVYGRNPHPGHLIAVVDLASRKLTGTIDVSPYQAPHGIQVDRNGTLYVTCDLSRKLLVIDPQKRSILAAIDTEGTSHWAAVLPDGRKAYAANKNDRPFVSVIDLKARKMIGRIPAPNGTEGITVSPDGKYVVAVDHVKPELIVIDPSTDAVLFNLALEGSPRGEFKPRFTPDGSKLLVCSLSGQVNIINVDDLHGKQVVLQVGKDPMGFAISPDGKTALVANHGDGTVSVIDLAQGRVVSSFKGGTGIETLSYY